MTLPPYTFSSAVSRWSFDLPVFVALVALLLVYTGAVWAARRRGRQWPWWRSASFAVLGLGFVAVCTMSSLAVYDHTYLWAIAAQLTLLISIAPLGIALGDPIGLARAALPDRGRTRLDRALTTPVVRVLTFPVVSAVLATTTIMLIFFTGLLTAAVHDDTALNLVYLLVLVVGTLAALPLLGAEILPAWCTDPIKLLFAFVDGLFDAIPGVVVMTTATRLAGGYFTGSATDPNWDAHVAGGLMLALTEVVALPTLVILFFRWAAHETKWEPPARPASLATPEPRAVEDPELLRPWWETDGLGARNRRFLPGED